MRVAFVNGIAIIVLQSGHSEKKRRKCSQNLRMSKNCCTFAAKFANSMDIVFQKDYLSDLYYTGKTSDKQHRYQPEVVRKYVRVVGILEAVSRMEDLFRFNSLHFEALNDTDYSVRIDYHYRLVFQMAAQPGETIFNICKLEDITNHYKA